MSVDELERTQRVLEFITRFQSHVLATGDLAGAFDEVLQLAVWITDSQFGFVGEVEEGPGCDEPTPVLVSRAITDIAWDEASRAIIEQASITGLRFENLDTLFGITLRTGETVLCNDPDDARRSGTPPGHPELVSYLGVQFVGRSGTRGMIGLANRPGGYGAHELELLEPLRSAAAALLDAEHHRRLADVARRRVDFARQLERITTTLSLDLLHGSAEPSGAAIETAIGGIGRLVGADRVYVFEFDDEAETFSNTFEWCAAGVDPAIDMLQDLPLSVYPWGIRRLTEQQLVVTRVDDLPPAADAERRILVEQAIRAVMWIPLQRDGRTVGFVGFDQVTGEQAWTEYDETALRSLGGTLSLAVARFRSQADLRESEQRLQRFASNLDVAMAIVDPGLGRGEFVNPAFTELTGIGFDEFCRDPNLFFPLVHPDDAPEVRLRWRRFAVSTDSNEGFDRTFRLVVNGSQRWVRMRAFPLDDVEGGRRRVGALVDDVTEIRKLQDTLTGALDRVAASNRAKSEFLSRVSHELRSPLQGTLGFLELLRLDPDAPDRDQFVGHAERSARHLVELIDDLLLVGRIEAGRVLLDESDVELGGFARDLVALHAPMFADRGIDATVEVVGDAAVVVRTDARRLGQVLGNLVSNAIKYNRPGGSVRIVIGENDGDARIAVVDTGPGISPDDLDRIFVPFERLSAERSGVQGTGIGLVVVKQLAGVLGGRVEVESTVGVGTTFRVVLPAATGRSRPAQRGFRVLLIEDSPESRLVLESALRRLEGVTLGAADSLEAGFASAVLEPPDLILLDRHLPDGDGIDAIGRFLALTDADQSVRIAIVSADAEPDSRERAIRAGAMSYFVKPIRLQDLIEFVGEQARRATSFR